MHFKHSQKTSMNVIDEIEVITYNYSDLVKYSFHSTMIKHRDIDMQLSQLYISGSNIQEHKIIVSYKNKVCHSINDEPAVIVYGNNHIKYMIWFYDGKIHRDGEKPAYINNCCKAYVKHNKLYRTVRKRNKKLLTSIDDQHRI